MLEKRPRRFGDRRDGHLVRDLTGLGTIMMHIMPKRTDAEVYLNKKVDVTKLVKYLEEKNASHPEYKTTIFHCFVVAIERMVAERPMMNRFIQNHHMYERDDITISFVAKRRFADGAEEALMVVKARENDTLDSVSQYIYGDVTKMRKTEHAEDGLNDIINKFAKIPFPILWLIMKLIMLLDLLGINIPALTEGDTNYTTVLLSNLGSIKAPAVYHHLNNYGTNSIMVTIGTMHKEEVLMPDGTRELRDIVEFGATLDERIGDGFYFARSLKLIEYIFDNPELLDRPLNEPSGFDYK